MVGDCKDGRRERIVAIRGKETAETGQVVAI